MTNFFNKLKKWYLRTFTVLSTKTAIRYNLIWHYNVYGDQINKINCRSIWIDLQGKSYRVKELKTIK